MPKFKALKSILLSSLFTGLLLGMCESANIMFFLGISSYSHRMGVWPLAEKLSERGHSVTFVSPFKGKEPHPNITDVVPKALKNWTDSATESNNGNFYDRRAAGTQDAEWFKIFDWGVEMCSVTLGDPEFLAWIEGSKFDLVIVDALVNECGYAMAHKFGAKVIIFVTTVPYPWMPEYFGYPDESSWIPDMCYHFPIEMTFYQRFISAMVPLYMKYLREFHYFPKLREIASNRLGLPNMPSFGEMEGNVSLVFTNQHYGEDFARPFPPNVIPVGGMHIQEQPGNISKELEDFIKTGTSGFIYLSFGSYVDFSTLPLRVQNVFIDTLNKFKDIKIIWRLDMERTDRFGDNIFTTKWVSQQAVLAHPKIRAFITHGGLFGVQEGIYHSVPMIAIPVFAEQDYNAVKLNYRQYGIHLDHTTITNEQLEDAINKVLNDKTYREKIGRASKVFFDRPEKAVDTAVWWTEFVLRHDDTSFLRPGSIKQTWWLKRQLDIWAIIFVAFLGIIYIVLKLIKIVLKMICLKRDRKTDVKLKSS